MIFHKKDLDLVLVPSGLLIMFTYHLFFLYRYQHAPKTTLMGVENDDKRAWVEGFSKSRDLTLDKRTFATNVISSCGTAATLLASVSLALSSLLGAWIANSTVDNLFRQLGGFGGTDPSTTAIKYISLLACFILAFAFFLQSARHFVHANYLITTRDDSIKEDAKEVIVKKSQQKNKSKGKEASRLMLSSTPGRTEEAENRGSKTYKSDKERTYVEEEEEYVHAAKKNEKKTSYENSA